MNNILVFVWKRPVHTKSSVHDIFKSNSCQIGNENNCLERRERLFNDERFNDCIFIKTAFTSFQKTYQNDGLKQYITKCLKK